jgi:hypothetical protein
MKGPAMNKSLCLLLALAACSQQNHDRTAERKASPPPALLPAKMSKAALMIPIPKDPAQLKRLLAMGYTVHEDHLHAPGVTSCPKMSENPVQ